MSVNFFYNFTAMSNDINSKSFFELLQRGDEASFTLLFNTYNLPLCSYAYRIVNNYDVAGEIVHTTFCKFWDNRKKIVITDSLKSYLYRSVYNNCISYLREQKQYKKYVDLGLTDLFFNRIVQDPHAELKLIDSENRKIILDAINQLPDKCKEIFIKCKIEGKSYPKVAEELSISIKTVENQMSSALKKLRQKLDWLLLMLMPL